MGWWWRWDRLTSSQVHLLSIHRIVTRASIQPEGHISLLGTQRERDTYWWLTASTTAVKKPRVGPTTLQWHGFWNLPHCMQTHGIGRGAPASYVNSKIAVKGTEDWSVVDQKRQTGSRLDYDSFDHECVPELLSTEHQKGWRKVELLEHQMVKSDANKATKDIASHLWKTSDVQNFLAILPRHSAQRG